MAISYWNEIWRSSSSTPFRYISGKRRILVLSSSLIHIVNVTIDKRFSKSKSAKSLAGNRTILLSKELVDIYQRNKDNICSIPIDGDNHLLFVNRFRGKNLPIGKVSFEQFIQKCAKRAGIEKHLTAHAFRHTHITNWIIQKVDLKTVMNRVGHRDASTTLAIYTHVTAQQQKKLADIIGA